MQTHCLEEIDVIILAGGLGTRLAGVLEGKPKLLAPICGRPFLEFILKWLSSYGARRIILSLGYLGYEIKEYVKDRFSGDMEIICILEAEPMGTAGGLANVSCYIESNLALVMNGDSFVDADLCELIDYHKSADRDATILCTRVANVERYGSIKLSDDGTVLSFQEKPKLHSSGFINAGVYVISERLLGHVKGLQTGSLEKDVFQKLPIGKLNAFSGEFEFLDIGTPEDYNRAQNFFRPFFNRWQ